VAEEFIVVTITEKWLGSAMLLRVLCIAAAFSPLSTVLSQYIVSRGRSGIYLGCTSVLCALLIGMMLVLHSKGIDTMVWAYTALFVVWFFVWYLFVKRLSGYSLFHLFKDTVPFLVIAAVVMVFTGWVTDTVDSLLLRLLLRIFIAASIYFIIMRTLRVKILDECLEFIKNKFRK
ncbi:MAG: polysaccharide biosynthesis C-terminal domain-containing protein, partial [Prevotella sp.]|nr:polysaccharide biosynthesis C-terminal domain-containing protein [Prevotella sp.]